MGLGRGAAAAAASLRMRGHAGLSEAQMQPGQAGTGMAHAWERSLIHPPGGGARPQWDSANHDTVQPLPAQVARGLHSVHGLHEGKPPAAHGALA